VANHKSALKRHRQSLKRNARNVAVKSSLKTSIKKVREAVTEKDAGRARELLVEATRSLDKAASKGVVHKNNAARRISRLAQRVNAIEQSSA
jgi:small subunit ribosomal protein S20